MTKIRTDIGYIAYRATADELTPIGGKGMCNACGRYSYHGYLIPVLNSYYCPECYRDFCSRGTFYPDDIGHETRVAAYYESKIPLDNGTKPEGQEQKSARCTICGESVSVSYTYDIAGVIVCDECIDQFYQDQASPNQLGGIYIAESEKRYLNDQTLLADSSKLYYNWWLERLEKQDRLRILKVAYETERSSSGMGYSPEWEPDFCICASDWKEFVSDKMQDANGKEHT